MRPTLLIVSYHFAPSPLVGAKRFSFLTREFTRQGFDVHVITNELRESPHGREDHSLPMFGTVHRVAAGIESTVVAHGPRGQSTGPWKKIVNAIFRRLLAPVGMEYFWARAATRKALEITRHLPAGVVIATNPPHSALIAGARIARRLRWPLILDYRDPWSAYDWPQWHRGGITQWLSSRIEARLVRRSAARVLNTPDMREWFEETFPFADAKRNFVVRNGFDAATETAAGAAPDSGPLRIVHAGEIYGSRTLVPLLQAVERLSSRYPERPIRVTTYGPLPDSEWERIRAAGLEGFIEDRRRIAFAALFPELQRAHVLLAVVSDHMTYSTPYKVYDYMAAGRPILGLAPRDAALHDLLAESGAGESAEPQDIPGIEQALERCLFAPARARDSRIDAYRWSNLAQKYRAVVDAVCTVSGTETLSAPDAPRTSG
jgi:hypothetical protein